MMIQEQDKIDELINLPKRVSLVGFDEFIKDYLATKADKKLALRELDAGIGLLQNHILLLSLHVKQNYLIEKKNETNTESTNEKLFTKKEISKIYKVSLKTVCNWISDGLSSIEIGGVVRISNVAIEEFKKRKRSKKFHWRSIAR